MSWRRRYLDRSAPFVQCLVALLALPGDNATRPLDSPPLPPVQPSRANCTNLDFTCYSEIAYNFVSYALHHAAMLYHDEGSAFFYTHDNAVLQPPSLRDPHGWWWSYLAAWADSGEWRYKNSGGGGLILSQGQVEPPFPCRVGYLYGAQHCDRCE